MVEAEREFVLNAAEERDIRFVQLWFTDVLGQLKAFAIPVEELPEALSEGASFDGASIEGFSRADESDMIAMPVPRTFNSLPWRPEKAGVARMFCDVLTADGEPFEGDPRRVLKHALERVRDPGSRRTSAASSTSSCSPAPTTPRRWTPARTSTSRRSTPRTTSAGRC
jgi:glutamine synthetase